MRQFFDLSHVIRDGMTTYKGLPGPVICDYLSRESSRAKYDNGTEFHIGRIDMVANTGTYIDAPFHRYADGADVSGLSLDSLADLPAVVVGSAKPAIDAVTFKGLDVRGKAVLIATGWDRHWGSDAYFEGHPYLTSDAAIWLREHGAVLVGIDSYNIDDTRNGTRPVHSILLRASIPIVEHMADLTGLPEAPLRFFAVPPKIEKMGTFPVRAFAVAQ